VIDQARRNLRFKFVISDADVRAADFAIELARAKVRPYGTLTRTDQMELCAALRRRSSGNADAARALSLVQQAQASNKALELSTEEKLLLVQVKAMVSFRNPFEVDLRKRIFILLTGRSDNWWAKSSAKALSRI